MADEAGRVAVHPLVEAFMPGPEGSRRVTFVGYPGPSTANDMVRLYTDLSFGTYLEFPAAAVAKAVPSQADDENGPTVVFVDAKAKVDRVSVQRTSNEAAFLSGAISAAHYGAASDPGSALGRGDADGGTLPTYYTCAPTQNIGCTGVAAFALKTGPVTIGYSATCSWIGCLRPDADIRVAEMARTGTASWVCQSVNCWPTSGNCLAAGAMMQPHLPVPGCACVATTVYTSYGHVAAAHAAPAPPSIAGCGTADPTCGHTGDMTNTTVCTPTGVAYLCPAG